MINIKNDKIDKPNTIIVDITTVNVLSANRTDNKVNNEVNDIVRRITSPSNFNISIVPSPLGFKKNKPNISIMNI